MHLKLLTQSHFACMPSLIQPFLHAISHLLTYRCFHLNNHSPKYTHIHTIAIFLKLTATAIDSPALHELTNPLNDRRACAGIEANYWNAGKHLSLLQHQRNCLHLLLATVKVESLKKYYGFSSHTIKNNAEFRAMSWNSL